MYTQRYSYYKTAKQNGFDSKFEAAIAQRLELEKKAGAILDYKTQVVLPLIVNGYRVATYKIDFVIEHTDGVTEYLEAKGYATDIWRLKWKLFEAIYSDLPNVKLTVEYQGKVPKPRKVKKWQQGA